MKKKRAMPKKKIIVPWSSPETPDQIAALATYVGSAEHKSHPSPAGPPKLRHNDASPCDPRYVEKADDGLVFASGPTNALRLAIRSGQTSDFTGRFPNYVWGVLDDVYYEARLVNQEAGTYKAYALDDEAELPERPEGILRWNPPR